jgi:hypothetical protein
VTDAQEAKMSNPTIRIPLAAALSTLAIAEAVALTALHMLPAPADLFLKAYGG